MQLLYTDRVVSLFKRAKYVDQKAIGSSSYYVLYDIDKGITLVDKKKNEKKTKNRLDDMDSCFVGAVVDAVCNDDPNCIVDTPDSDLSAASKDSDTRYYKINKKQIKNKLFAFFALDQSKCFMAFYSLSFPKGMTDDDVYKALNTWLTNCRTRYGLKSYLWVAERQKNGTIHFHLCTNNFMRIKDVNNAMGVTISHLGYQVSVKGYNGVDVVKVQGNEAKLAAYITKYICKQDHDHNKFTRQSWRCSRDISALFTASLLDVVEGTEIMIEIDTKLDNVQVYDNDYGQVIIFRLPKTDGSGWQTISDRHYSILRQINQLVYDKRQTDL